jgi:thymidylate kinase
MTEVYWFEGPDMWGKTIQIKEVSKRLKDEGYSVLILKNPGGAANEVCGKIRSILLDVDSNKEESLDYMTRRALNVADHMQKMKIIRDNIGKYDYILCDRCHYVTDMTYTFMLEDDPYKKQLKATLFSHMFALNRLNKGLLYDENDRTRHYLILGVTSEKEMIRRFEQSGRNDKLTIYDETDMAFKLRIRENYEHIIKTYLGMERTADTPYIKAVLDSFGFISTHCGDSSADIITNDIVNMALAVRKASEENTNAEV